MRDPVLEKKRDLSISVAQANIIVLFISIPVVILRFAVFLLWHDTAALIITGSITLLIRKVKAGMLVEDHPINAGCYVLES